MRWEKLTRKGNWLPLPTKGKDIPEFLGLSWDTESLNIANNVKVRREERRGMTMRNDAEQLGIIARRDVCIWKYWLYTRLKTRTGLITNARRHELSEEDISILLDVCPNLCVLHLFRYMSCIVLIYKTLYPGDQNHFTCCCWMCWAR